MEYPAHYYSVHSLNKTKGQIDTIASNYGDGQKTA